MSSRLPMGGPTRESVPGLDADFTGVEGCLADMPRSLTRDKRKLAATGMAKWRAMVYFPFWNSMGGASVPLYEYKCVKCGRRTEKIENVSGPHLKKCPHCGGKVESLISAPAIQFKGSGWYVTDYAGKKPSSSGDSSKDERTATESKD